MNDQWRTDTAERPAVVVSPEPTQPSTPVAPPPPDAWAQSRERAPLPGWIAWVIVALTLVVVAVMGVRLVLQPPGTSSAVDPAPSASDEPPAEEDQAPEEEVSQEPASEEPAEPTPSDAESSPAEDPPELIALAGMAEVTVPAAAPPNNDVTGEQVTFVGPNMLDVDNETAWRMAGDASGRTITFTFDEPVTITAIGLLNGYAKISTDASGQQFNWYAGNRRVRSVEWVLGDLVVSADYADTMDGQSIAVEPTQTSTVELRLIEVSLPGPGPTGRDYTAISEVAFSGYVG